MFRPLPPLLFLVCLGLALALHLWWPLLTWAPRPYSLAGLLLLPPGLWLLIRASGLFNRIGTNIHTFRDPDVLVTDGPFRLSRNPMYLGFLLVLLGGCIALGTLTPLLACVGFALVANFWYVPFEERACAARFGDAYQRYCARTRRWL
ncbi:MAG: isoprenylcysteine carboxylmethyltransferase family protein [Pseudomonadales bacterium]